MKKAAAGGYLREVGLEVRAGTRLTKRDPEPRQKMEKEEMP
jgi:hypothetical protein